MKKFIFSGLRESYLAFKKLPVPEDIKVKKSLDTIKVSKLSSEGLGFHKDELQDIVDLIKNHGDNLNDAQLKEVMNYLQESEIRAQNKRIFWVKLFVTIIFTVGIFTVIFLHKNLGLDEENEKYLYGLLGVILGHWLA